MMPTHESKTKSKAKRVKMKTFTEDEMQTMIKKAREEEADKVRAEVSADEHSYFDNENSYNEEAPSLFGENTMFRAPVTDIQGDEMDDVFTHCEKNYHLKGKLIAYVIKKDGQFVGEQYHPFSWTKVQEKYGGGNFIVMAKDANTKTYIKQQTMLVQELPKSSEEREPVIIHQQQQAPQHPPLDMKTLLDFITQAQMVNKSDDKAIAREEARSSTTIMTALMDSQQRASQQLTDMMFKMQEQTNRTIQSMSENTNKQNEETRKLILEMLKQKPKEEFSTKDLLLLQANARAEGVEQMKMLMELADAKAEEKAELMAGNDNDGSTLSKMVGLVGPLIQATTKQMQGAPMMPQQMRALPPQRPAQPRRVIQQPRPVQVPTQRAAAPQAQAQNNKGQNSISREEDQFAKSLFTPVGDDIESKPEVEQTMSPAPENIESIDVLFSQASEIQQKVAMELIPVLAESLTLTPLQGSERASVILNSLSRETKIPVQGLLKEFTFDLVWKIAKAFGINDEKSHQWFKEFYVNVEKSAESNANGPS